MVEPITQPSLAAANFKRTQLTRALQLRCMKKKELAEMIGKSPSAITQLEQGKIKPDASTLSAIALAMNLPVAFFARAPYVDAMREDACHFRSRRSSSAYSRREAMARGEVLLELVAILGTKVKPPPEELTAIKDDLYNERSVEVAAAKVREAWGLGQGALPTLLWNLEQRGVLILPLPRRYASVDAFSCWHGGRPVMFLDFNLPASKVHFDASHELGHLILHDDVEPGSREIESQADRFASAFLMPRATFGRECPKRWGMKQFLALKARWYTSMQSCVMRGHALGILSDSSKRGAFKAISASGQRKKEAGEWELSRPLILNSMMERVASTYSITRLAELLCVKEGELLELLAGCGVSSIPSPISRRSIR